MKNKIEALIPHFFLIFTASIFAINPITEAIWFFAIAALLWIVSFIFPKIFPVEKPTKLASSIDKLEAKVFELEKSLVANSEYMAKELGTIKSVMQIKQLGR